MCVCVCAIMGESMRERVITGSATGGRVFWSVSGWPLYLVCMSGDVSTCVRLSVCGFHPQTDTSLVHHRGCLVPQKQFVFSPWCCACRGLLQLSDPRIMTLMMLNPTWSKSFVVHSVFYVFPSFGASAQAALDKRQLWWHTSTFDQWLCSIHRGRI